MQIILDVMIVARNSPEVNGYTVHEHREDKFGLSHYGLRTMPRRIGAENIEILNLCLSIV